MLSLKQKNNLRLEWRNCPVCEKKSIMADFIREYGNDSGWDTWLTFLEQRLNASCPAKLPQVSGAKDLSV